MITSENHGTVKRVHGNAVQLNKQNMFLYSKTGDAGQ